MQTLKSPAKQTPPKQRPVMADIAERERGLDNPIATNGYHKDNAQEIKSLWDAYLGIKPEASQTYVQKQEQQQTWSPLEALSLEPEKPLTTIETKEVVIGGMNELKFGSPEQDTSAIEFAPVPVIAAEPELIADKLQHENQLNTVNLKNDKITDYIDFPLFFNWVKDGLKAQIKIFKDTGLKSLIWNDIFGFGGKKKEGEKGKKDDKKAKPQPAPMPFIPAAMSAERKAYLDRQKEDINKRVGANNQSFEGFIGSDGQIRKDMEVVADRLASQMKKQQEQAQKKRRFSFAGKGKPKPGQKPSTNLNQATENDHHATKLQG